MDGLVVIGRNDKGVLLSVRPVARAPPVVCHGKNSKLFCADMVDDAVWEATEDIASTRATKYGTEQRIGQNEIGCKFELSYKRETKLDIRL